MSSPPAMDVVVEVSDRTRASIQTVHVRSLVEYVLSSEGVHHGEVGVHFVGERRIRQLNESARGVDAVTDVLSFPLESPGEAALPGVPRLLGDVVVCPRQARRQAHADGTPPAYELGLLVVHGLLHLLGWEHDEVPGDMARRQTQLVDAWDWGRLW